MSSSLQGFVVKGIWIHGDHKSKMKVWESPFIPSHLTFKRFWIHSLSINQSNNQSNLSVYYNIPKFRILGCYNFVGLSLPSLLLKEPAGSVCREGIDNPFIALVARFLFVCVGAWDLRVASYWIDTLVLKNWGKYLRYFAASPFPLQEPTQCSRGSTAELSMKAPMSVSKPGDLG